MEKVSEKVDLSKKVLEIDIESPVFKCMLHDLNKEIKRVIEKVYDEEFEAGEITVKLALMIPNGYKEYPRVDEFGDASFETYKYRRPHFEHKVSTTLKKQYKQEGIYSEEKEVRFKDGHYVVVPIIEPQMSIFDDDEDEDEDFI